LELNRGLELLGRWGDPGEGTQELTFGPVTVRLGGPRSGLVQACARLLARHLPVQPEDTAAAATQPSSGLVGRSRALEEVRRQIARLGPLPLNVLIQGEPGTGKELVARELHRASGRRGELVPLNCAGVPATLLETELFGAVRGAYTGADRDRQGLVEAAEGGTLLLDEIGELPLELQGKLLRLLQEHEVRRVGATRSRTVDVRFLAATNRDLMAAVKAGRFREDLYYRLAVTVISVPPLRERPDDVEELAHRITASRATRFGRPGVRLSPGAVELLRRARWPGNVRELESMIERAVAAARPGQVLGPESFADVAPAATTQAEPGQPWHLALEGFRRVYFARLLEECRGNRSEAARRAGMSRQALLYQLKELGLTRKP
jgi:two-component system response regulator AtoC